MLHPSYSDLMRKVNSEAAEGEEPIVNSRYSIVMATAKRARQIVEGEAAVTEAERKKPLSTAVRELDEGHIHILHDLPEDEEDDALRVVMRDEAQLMGESLEEFEGTEENAAEAEAEPQNEKE